jgi:integrase
MREGELLGLQWDDIDWARNLIDLRRTVAFRKGALIVNSPKSGKLRTIDLPVSLVAWLREFWSIRQAEAAVAGTEASRWSFPAGTDHEKPLNDASFRDRVWRPLLAKAEMRHIRVHDARHTYASLMLRRGVLIAYISRQLAHRNRSGWGIYRVLFFKVPRRDISSEWRSSQVPAPHGSCGEGDPEPGRNVDYVRPSGLVRLGRSL